MFRSSQEPGRSEHHPGARACPPAVACTLAVCLAFLILAPTAAFPADVLTLRSTVSVRQRPHISSREMGTVRAGESYEVAARPSGKQPRYILDDEGHLWMKIRVSDELAGFVQTDQVSVAREEFRSPRGNPLLLVNIRTTSDGDTDRDLWLIQDSWRSTARLASIEGRPIWAPSGEWFLCQVESRTVVRDNTMERMVERLERFERLLGQLVGESDNGTLLLTTRKLRWTMVRPVREANPGQCRHSALTAVTAATTVSQSQFHIGQCRKARHQVKSLENKANFPAPYLGQLAAAEAADFPAFEIIAARSRLVQATDKVKDSRLTGARGAHNCHQLSPLNLHVYPVEHTELSFPDMVDFGYTL